MASEPILASGPSRAYAIAFEVLICAFSHVSQHFVFKPRFRCALPMVGCASRPERAPDNFITKLKGNL